jgi:hypothetical protein
MSNINSIQTISVPIRRYLNGSNYAENGNYLIDSFVNNRNFAIFAPSRAYEIQ